MKKIALLTILSVLWIFMGENTAIAGMPHQDKVAHGVAVFTITHVGYVLCKNHLDPNMTDGECMAMAIGLGVVAALMKESVIDSKPDNWDHVGNAVGLGLAIPFLVWEY
jgi:drug/metabolite transporter superfamily protein YnfA